MHRCKSYLSLKDQFFRDTAVTNPYIFAANVPLRVWHCITALQDKWRWQVALDVLAFSSLLFPLYGVKGVIFIDLTSEVTNVYIKMHQNDPTHHSFFFWSFLNWRRPNIKPPCKMKTTFTTSIVQFVKMPLEYWGYPQKKREIEGYWMKSMNICVKY